MVGGSGDAEEWDRVTQDWLPFAAQHDGITHSSVLCSYANVLNPMTSEVTLFGDKTS